MRQVKPAKNSLRWKARLEVLRRGVRRLLNRDRNDRISRSWEL
jgi:hypothetical protein